MFNIKFPLFFIIDSIHKHKYVHKSDTVHICFYIVIIPILFICVFSCSYLKLHEATYTRHQGFVHIIMGDAISSYLNPLIHLPMRCPHRHSVDRFRLCVCHILFETSMAFYPQTKIRFSPSHDKISLSNPSFSCYLNYGVEILM